MGARGRWPAAMIAVAAVLGTGAATGAASSPPLGRMLTSDLVNPPGRSAGPAVCGRRTYLRGPSPPGQWMPVRPGVTSVAVGVALRPHVSTSDVPFTHPFGNDAVFYVAPDPAYRGLLDRGSRGAPGDPDAAGLGRAIVEARRRGLAVPKGVLGVEIDKGLLPAAFRPRAPRGPRSAGDRVAVFGSWIVDCGHDDFHTEIHPPLAVAVARATPGRDAARSTLIARPFLVGQRFDAAGLYAPGQGLYGHLLDQVLHGRGPFFAFPQVSATPFEAAESLSYTLSPPRPPRPGEVLAATWHLTVRTGVTASVTPGSGGLRVAVTMDPAGYVPPPRVTRTCTVSVARLARASGEVAGAIRKLRIVPGVARRLRAGIRTACDAIPAPPRPVALDNAVVVDDSQPYPVAGWIDVAWRAS
jgi:hypothetical protein